MVITMAKLRMAHASTHGARKLPGPIIIEASNYEYYLKKNQFLDIPSSYAKIWEETNFQSREFLQSG